MRMRAKTLRLALALGLLSGVAVSGAAAMAANGNVEADESLVEDYSYPGAAEIKTKRGVELISGDGRITLLDDCNSPAPKIRVETFLVGGERYYCFAVQGNSGYLKVNVPNVYLVWSGDEPLNAKYTVDGVADDVDVRPNDLATIGTSSPDRGVLLELRAG